MEKVNTEVDISLQDDSEQINRTVLVSNISPNATSKTVTDFFAFCGTIQNLTMRNTITSTEKVQEAIIEFKQEAAAKTALLLTNALILDRPITVSKYRKEAPKSTEEIEASQSKSYSENEIENKAHAVPADQRTHTSVIASLLAAGYHLGTETIEAARQYDEKHAISQNIKQGADQIKVKASELDNQYKITETTTAVYNAAKDKITEVDKRYGLSDSAANLALKTEELVKQVGESPTVKDIKNKGEVLAAYAEGITAEVARKIEGQPAYKSASETISKTSQKVKDEYKAVVDQTNKLIVEQGGYEAVPKEEEELKERKSDDEKKEGETLPQTQMVQEVEDKNVEKKSLIDQ